MDFDINQKHKKKHKKKQTKLTGLCQILWMK